MYCNYYSLSSLPFEISPDPKFLWIGKKYGEALAAIRYGIHANKGFISLTGDVGTGKTTIVNALAKGLSDHNIIVKISNPSLDPLDFFNFTANAFDMNKTFKTKGDFLSHLEIFLNNADANNRKVTVVIEEAQLLKKALLDDIRLLSNIEKPNKKLINILFVGQNEFNDLLKTNKALRHRVTVNCRIEPLTEIETEKYILHRLKIAGSKSRIFSERAMREIFAFSEGNPRLVNIICDLALLSGYVEDAKSIGSEIMRECTASVLLSNKKCEEGVEYPKTIAKTIQRKKISELASLKDSNSIVSKKEQVNSVRRKHFFLVSISLLILAIILGSLYHFDINNLIIKNLKPNTIQSSSFKTVSKLKNSSPQLHVVESTNSFNENKKVSDNVHKQSALILQADETKIRHTESNRIQSQLSKLKGENAANENRIAELMSVHDKFLVKKNELRATKKSDGAPKIIINKSDKMPPNLVKKNSNNRQIRNLSDNSALTSELQKKLDSSKSYHYKLENAVKKSKKQIDQLQDRLLNLNVEKASMEQLVFQLKAHKKTLATEIKKLKARQKYHQALGIDAERSYRTLAELQQKLKELENASKQEKDRYNRVLTNLSAKKTLVAKLQKKLEVLELNHLKLEREAEKSSNKIAKLEGELFELYTKQIYSIKFSSDRSFLEKLPEESNTYQKESKHFDHTAIIDWIIKKNKITTTKIIYYSLEFRK
jgi:type II secretory pathway predicted ATPase ExeA